MTKDPISSAFDTYTLVRAIGEGGNGFVYEGLNLAGETVAIKVLKKDLPKSKRKRFKNEVLFGQRHQHPNIISVVDSGAFTSGNNIVAFYVMPLYQATLRKIMSKAIPPKSILPLFLQLLDGVEAAHLFGVNHRDLKPENVLFDPPSNVLVVADFGAAEFAEDDEFTIVETKPGEKIGNFQYAAPEQRRAGQVVDHRADIYSLGLMLNEMFTGQVPAGTGHKSIGSVAPDYGYLDDISETMRRQEPGERPPSIQAIKNQITAKGSDFVAFQRLDALKKQVVLTTTPTVPAPVQVKDLHVSGEIVVFIFEYPPTPKWIEIFRDPRINSHALWGYGVETVQFNNTNNGSATMRAPGHALEEIVRFFKQWVQAANMNLPKVLEMEARKRDADERERLRRDAETQARTLDLTQRARRALLQT